MRTLVNLLLCLLFATAALAGEPQLDVEEIASGLNMPIGLGNAGDNRMFIVLQRGQIVIWDGSQVLPTPFLDLQSLGIVACCGEQGLLDIAFHPRFHENGLYYVSYVDRSGDLNIVRYKALSTNPNLTDTGAVAPVLKIAHRDNDNHYSGNLVFGPDGYLYVGVGDGGGAGDQNNNAQNLSRYLGKILRLDVDNATPANPYAIPLDNPFRERPNALGEIWDYGLRNPWRFTFDRETGDLFIADVGQSNYEEVNFEPASSIGGVNYGWRNMEGFHCFNPAANCDISQPKLPILEYNHLNKDCSVTGGYRYRGTRYPNMRGIYFYGDYCTGKIWGASENPDEDWSTHLFLTTGFNITSFGEDATGELYFTNHKGSVYRLVDQSEQEPQEPRRRRALR